MSGHPLNLALRFALELIALYAMGYWGWVTFANPWRWLAAIALPLIAAAIWGVFRVPDDGGAPVVQVPGLVRLALEAVYFTAAVLGLWFANRSTAAIVLLVVVVAHYLLSLDRVNRLIHLP